MPILAPVEIFWKILRPSVAMERLDNVENHELEHEVVSHGPGLPWRLGHPSPMPVMPVARVVRAGVFVCVTSFLLGIHPFSLF